MVVGGQTVDQKLPLAAVLLLPSQLRVSAVLDADFNRQKLKGDKNTCRFLSS